MNQVGKYAAREEADELELMRMVMELPEKDKMLMWAEGYIDQVIDKLPEYAQDILENRKQKWEDTKAFFESQINEILKLEEFKNKAMGERKEFALFVMENYREYQSLLFAAADGKMKEEDYRKFVYRRRFGSRKKFLRT
ncbi:hypothetical protein [Bacillus sp. MRMR6]|uniref:hypothetical protein n=1 Tax=Bacillus sp. MRMR6 TaxID=1928617 RepID=UPI00095356EC|nr:hypothetical protein [Bacillus sp. MRMR6]OLS39933.1 hypothetical protein BTR25_12020 [Bacillus sp. MRMR6]